MTLPKLAVSLAVLAALLAALYIRAISREAAIEAAFPPTGQFVTVDGHKVHAIIAGSGPDLILIHGASGNARDMVLALMDALAANYRVIAFDRPGLGWSDPIADTSLKAQALHLSAAATALGVTDPIIVGQSYGGSVTLAWAVYAPLKPRALVLVSAPSLPWPGTLDIWYRITNSWLGDALAIPLAVALLPESYIDQTTTAIFAPDAVPLGYGQAIGVMLTLRRDALRTNAAQVNGLRAQIVAMQPLYAGLTLPVQLIHGTADTIVPLNIHSALLVQQLPNAELTVIEGAGHMPHHSHRQLVLDAIARAAALAPLH